MVRRLLNAALGKTEEDDRDHYGKKRIDTAGALIEAVFVSQYKLMMKNAEKSLKKQLMYKPGQKINQQSIFESDLITNKLINSLATGNWGITSTGDIAKKGVA